MARSPRDVWNKRMFIDRIEVIDKPKKRGKGF